MTNAMPSIESFTQAATQNDRWWFLAAIVVGALSAGYAVRYLVAKLEAANDARIEELKGKAREGDQLAERLGQIIERNTAALQRQVESSEAVSEAIKDLCREVEVGRRAH